MNKISCFCLALSILGLPSFSLAQSSLQRVVSIHYESGPLLSNGTEWGDEVKNATEYKALDVRFGWRKISDRAFDYLYRYPTFGLGMNITLPYFEEIGQPYAVYGYMDIPFSMKRPQNPLQFGYFTQFGVGFNLKPYDPENNPINQYIGSKVNAFVHVGFQARYQLNSRMDLESSIGLKHFSNGSSKKPNSGINLIPFSLGVKYRLGALQEIPERRIEVPKKERRDFWNLMVYTGVKNYDIGEPTYFRGGLGFNYLIEPAYKYRLGLGLDLFYAQGLASRNREIPLTFKNQTSLALVASWEWQLTERLYVPIGFGAYLYRNVHNQEITWFYERIGVRYRFDQNLFAGMQIKAHKAKADFFEFTFGYTLPQKR